MVIALNPAPVITSAVSRAKTSLLWRASYPMTTVPPAAPVSLQVRRQAGRRADDDDAVHPVGPGAERAAQAGRTELQRAGEAVGQVGGVAARLDVGDDGLQLGAGDRVGVLGGPGAGEVEEVGGGGGGGAHGGTVSAAGRTRSARSWPSPGACG